MSNTSNVARMSFSELEKKFAELTQLQKHNLDLLLQIENTRLQVLEAKFIAEIEAKVYSDIKKYFK